MKIAFISDLHACLTAVQSVLANCQARGVDRIVCLGDVIDMGPEPADKINGWLTAAGASMMLSLLLDYPIQTTWWLRLRQMQL